MYQPQYQAPYGQNPPRRAFAGPYDMFYPDPYEPLQDWILIDEMLQHRAWGHPWVVITSKAGEILMTGDEVAVDKGRLAWHHRAVAYDVDGSLQVHATDG